MSTKSEIRATNRRTKKTKRTPISEIVAQHLELQIAERLANGRGHVLVLNEAIPQGISQTQFCGALSVLARQNRYYKISGTLKSDGSTAF